MRTVPHIEDIQAAVNDSGEVRDALDQLAMALEYAHNDEARKLVWDTFVERMKPAVMRARGYAQDTLEGA